MGCRIDIQGRPDDLPHPVPAPSSPAPPPLPHRLLSWKIDRIVMCLTQNTLDARIDVSAINILTLSAFKDASQAMLKAKYRVSSARRASSSSSASGSSNSNSGMHEVAPPRSRASASAGNSRSAVQKVAVQYWRRWFGGAETIGPWHDVNEFAHLLISDPCHNHGKGAFLEFFRSTTSDCEPAPPKPFEFSPHSIGANGVQITPSVSQQLPHTFCSKCGDRMPHTMFAFVDTSKANHVARDSIRMCRIMLLSKWCASVSSICRAAEASAQSTCVLAS